MPIYMDGQEYPDELSFEAATNPAIPADLKRVYITKEEGEDTPTSTMPLGSPTEVADALFSLPGTPVAPDVQASPEAPVRPEPYGLNPPERGPGFKQDRGEPKVLYKTKSGIEITDHDIDDAMELGGNFAGIMAGVKGAKGANTLNDLGHAQMLESKGYQSDSIRHQTGWERGTEGRWKFEIDDASVKLDIDWINRPPVKTPEPKDPFEQVPFNPYEGQVAARLDSILDHPELYKAYPELKDITVVYNPALKDSGGYADFKNHRIVIGKELAQNRGTFLHEIQHFIQNYEGFAQGAAPRKTPTNYRLKYQKDVDDLLPEMKTLYKKYSEDASITAEELDRLIYLQKVADTYNKYVKAADAEALDLYMRMAGEVEARNVEFRELLDPGTRRRYGPSQSEKEMGYPREKQIVVSKPVGTTAYGYVDPDTGKRVKPK